MDMWQDAVPYPVGEATAEAGGQHEPVSGGLKPGAGALLGILQLGRGDADDDIPWGWSAQEPHAW